VNFCRRYTAQQALEWGLANAVVPLEQLDAEVKRWGEEILALSPTVIKLLKKSFDGRVPTRCGRRRDRTGT
jgi:1,4-dihydroxy-2-naphthoyl-CoA synthase